ncbi:MAG TPA: serine/threonine-protein kinase, partial [Kofleriaceae bacterium]|nr:serine/threonine-protein kinase [Kofleriaceae bacterium]
MTTPSHIGQYRIVRKLGAGGMGMVFLGEHMLLGRRAAIKTLLPTVQVNQEIVERFFNEARAASAITDPGVIQIFDFGYHVDGTAYIVMELLEGEALSARIDRVGKLPLPDAIRIARQIAGSLAAAHARNIVHRDLKPENIFLVRDAEAQGGERTKILDFGICKLSQADGDVAVTQVGAMVGTPVYMSPEQCRGASDVDHRSDIYAFGCLVFHMLTGRPPFVGESSGDLIVAHMQADPPAPSLYVSGLPFEVDALLLRCLAKAPEDRFSSMSELHLVLGDIYAQLDPVDYTATPVTPAMQRGQGFRSVYDGNFSRIAGGSSRISP